MNTITRIAWIALVFLPTGVAHAGQAEAAFFEAKIRPLLVARCYQCHSAEKGRKGGLLLDAKSGWQTGGDSGPALVPGDPEKSLLVRAVTGADPDWIMPPKEAGDPLSKQQIADVVTWIKSGAFDPRDAAAAAASAQTKWEENYRQRRQWWSLQPLKPLPVEVPGEGLEPEWTENRVDRYLRAAMRRQGIAPAPVADPATLLRRLSLVLTGLPPAADAVERFTQAAARDFAGTYAATVTRMLDSPHFGERFARHWLDVVRFTETHGNEWNYDAPYAWRYRDYVIRALNADVPYDRFVKEHIAGDLLHEPRFHQDGHFDESPIGTAFFRFGEVNHDSCTSFPVIGYDILDNQLDTLTKAFQATTAACARCHDHKMDAISTKDYHALLAVLRSSRPVMRTLDGPEVNRDATAQLRDLKRQLRAELANIWRAEAKKLDAATLNDVAHRAGWASLVGAAKTKTADIDHLLYPWITAARANAKDYSATWTNVGEKVAKETAARAEFNRTQFTTLADFRVQMPAGWYSDGMGLRQGQVRGGDFVPAHEGPTVFKAVLPDGLFTFALSDRLNGALRSPTLRRSHAKVSFEVLGGRFSLTRLVFNNCQLNYDRQHSIHHDSWSWVTIDWPDKSDALAPYLELLTFWDNPKFPDPLGTLGKDTENQREPYDVHAKNPRSWWGVRRIVLHDGAAPPKTSLTHFERLFVGAVPTTPDEAAARYRAIAVAAVERFAEQRASDEDIVWLDGLVRNGLLSNRNNASAQLATLSEQYRAIENRLALPTTMPGMADEGTPVGQPVFERGDLNKPGETIPRGYLRMLTPTNFSVAGSGSGRREWAEFIASPTNPLTARVMVNRVWSWVFGRGLVGTPDDFGHLGEPPLHPRLLDDLASRFVAEGWSVKKLVRVLVLTRAFRSASAPTPESAQRDPANHAFAHYTARRAEAEVIRDSLLAVSGQLKTQLYGPSVHPFRAKPDNEKRLYSGPLDGNGRRSIYIKFQLMEQPAFLRAFNLPGGKVAEGRRESSNTPAQSLAMLNDPLVLELAQRWAERQCADGATTPEQRLHAMFRAALARAPTATEAARFRDALRAFARFHQVPDQAILASRAVWREVAHTIFNLKEFIFIP